MPQDQMSKEMPRYLCHKEVRALEIASMKPVALGYELTFVEDGYAPITVDDAFCARGKPNAGDFYVVYDDSYASWSPRAAFLDGYSPVEEK